MKNKNSILLLAFFILCSVSIFSQQKATIIVNADQTGDVISKHIYGHFSEHLGRCIYGGIWVGEDSEIPNTKGIRNDVLEALKKIEIPNVRWPGGCFADEYHWMDGIGPKAKRPKMINTHWGGVVEDNSFGTHEFMDFCELVGTEPYFCGNVGSGTVEEMSEWVEYLTFDGESPMSNLRKQNGRAKPWKVEFWAVGNENWGCGGNMSEQFYADQYKRYATYCRNYGNNKLFKVASGGVPGDFEWVETVMKNVGPNLMQGIALHYYTITHNWQYKGSATEFDENEYFKTINSCLGIEHQIKSYINIMDKYDPDNRVALIVDEWGNWFEVEPGTNPGFLYQQNTLRDAITAATSLNIFNRYCHRIKMANIAQIINVLQSLILTKDDDMLLTPTYHVFDMFRVHHDAELIPLYLSSPDYIAGDKKVPAVNASASKDKGGNVNITLVNVDPSNSIEITLDFRGNEFSTFSGKVITAETIQSHNTFENKEVVRMKSFDDFESDSNILKIKMPAKSVVSIACEE
ncbi:MAG: alpha-N-arabinofuranosidase [Ignavibacteria bacterium]|jgi:alpha-N-arabinofuranosidase